MSKSNLKETTNTIESIDVYTDEEIVLLDKYHNYTNNKLDDEEIYYIIVNCNFDDNKITIKLAEMMKDLKRGHDYEWHEIIKSKELIAYFFRKGQEPG